MTPQSNPTAVSDEQLSALLEKELLQLSNVDRVVRVTVLHSADGSLVVGAKVSLPAQLQMQQVSATLTLAELRIARVLPEATHIFVTPDVFFDDSLTASTSTIVTLSYD